MNIKHKALWASFVLTQGTGAILAIMLPQSHPPHYLWPVVAIAFPLAAICLLPGIFVADLFLEALHFPSTDPSIVVTAVILNGIVWYALRMVVRRIPNE